MKDDDRRCYRIEPEECSPPRMPWATRQVRTPLLWAEAGAHILRPPKLIIALGRQVRVVYKGAVEADRVVKDFTLVDYLSLPQPRTTNTEQALAQLVAGHGHKLDFSRLEPGERMAKIDEWKEKCKETPVDPSEVRSIDWWCDKISKEGRELRDVHKQERLGEMRQSIAMQQPRASAAENEE